MTRFDEVARLRELEKKEDGDWSYSTSKNGITHIWGSDDDEVAEVYDNLGMDVSGEDRAQFILSAKDDLPWLLKAAAIMEELE